MPLARTRSPKRHLCCMCTAHCVLATVSASGHSIMRSVSTSAPALALNLACPAPRSSSVMGDTAAGFGDGGMPHGDEPGFGHAQAHGEDYPDVLAAALRGSPSKEETLSEGEEEERHGGGRGRGRAGGENEAEAEDGELRVPAAGTDAGELPHSGAAPPGSPVSDHRLPHAAAGVDGGVTGQLQGQSMAPGNATTARSSPQGAYTHRSNGRRASRSPMRSRSRSPPGRGYPPATARGGVSYSAHNTSHPPPRVSSAPPGRGQGAPPPSRGPPTGIAPSSAGRQAGGFNNRYDGPPPAAIPVTSASRHGGHGTAMGMDDAIPMPAAWADDVGGGYANGRPQSGGKGVHGNGDAFSDGTISLTDASCIFVRRDEMDEAATRPGEDVHTLFRGALVRVRGPAGAYAVREVYRAKVTSAPIPGAVDDHPSGVPVLQLQLLQEPDCVYTSAQVSNAAVTLTEWRQYTAELAREGRNLSMAHAMAVCHNLGRAPPPGTPAQHAPASQPASQPSGAMDSQQVVHQLSAEDADRARRRAARFGSSLETSTPASGPGTSGPGASWDAGNGQITRVYHVEQQYMGALIGREHRTVNTLRQQHGVDCVVDSSRCTATVTGTPAAVDAIFGDFERIVARCIATQEQHAARNAGVQPPAGAGVPVMTPQMVNGGHNPANDDPRYMRAVQQGDIVTAIVDARGHLGAVIGPNGTVVRRIQAQHGVVVDKMQETKQVKVSGSAEAVRTAIIDIEQVVAKAASDLQTAQAQRQRALQR